MSYLIILLLWLWCIWRLKVSSRGSMIVGLSSFFIGVTLILIGWSWGGEIGLRFSLLFIVIGWIQALTEYKSA